MLSSYSLIAHHIAWLKAQGSSCPRVCTHLIHAWERYSSTLSSPFHPTSYSCYSLSISSSSCCPSTSTRISSNTAYSANKETGSTDASFSLTETALENLYSNLRLLGAPSCLHLLHLTCLFLVFLLKCCNGSSLKPARPLCDGRFFAFSPPGGLRRLFPRLPFSMGSTFCLLSLWLAV